jgi:hypothetical protein
MEMFIVPASVTYINIDITGAAGGSSGNVQAGVQASIPVNNDSHF